MPGGTRSGGPYKLRLPIFLQPLGGALKNRSAAPASPPCFRRRRRSAPQLFESTLAAPFARQIKQKLRYPLDTGVLGGRGWIRTTEAESSRFTVCPHWPLGNTPIFFCVRRADCLYILPRAKQFVNHLQQILSQFLHQSLQQTRPMEKPPGNQCSRAVFLGAGDRS